MSYTTPEERSIIHELTGRRLVPRRGLFNKVYSLERPEEGLGTRLVAGIAALAAAAGLSKAEPAYAQDTDSHDFPRIGIDVPAEPPITLLAESMANRQQSDTRLELKIEGYDAAVENWTADGHQNGTTAFGVMTPVFFDLLSARGTGFVNYGEQGTGGGYNLASFFHLGSFQLGVGGGQVVGTGADHWRTRAMFGFDLGLVKFLSDVFYDSGSEGLDYGIDSRGLVRVAHDNLYIALGKGERYNGGMRIAYVNPGGFGVVFSSFFDYDSIVSRNSIIISTESTVTAPQLDRLLMRELPVDGRSDFVTDPFLGFEPYLGQYGRFNVRLEHIMRAGVHTGSAQFAYNPQPGGLTFFQLGVKHDQGEGVSRTALLLDVFTEFSGVFIAPSIEIGIQDQSVNALLYAGYVFDLQGGR